MPRKATTRLPLRDGAPPLSPETAARARRILTRLGRAYPEARCALDFDTPLDLYVATVLSAQCTDERVNMVTKELFRACRTPQDYLALGPARLETLIHSTGFFRAKTRNILGGCQVILERFGGELPRTIEELVTIPGCGRKTANVILGNAFDIPGITVDTHVQRISRRLDLTQETDAVKIEGALQRLFPERSWTLLSHRLIAHGRRICDARKPACDACPLIGLCPWPATQGLLGAARPTARKPSASAATLRTPAARTQAAPKKTRAQATGATTTGAKTAGSKKARTTRAGAKNSGAKNAGAKKSGAASARPRAAGTRKTASRKP